ncbi:hypothetical protein [Falseniella ignava]|uniref:Uncharacterized protein n=1 Tax=Falseniella ignava CCUG 37419 TaxID=883112 RepID=K1MQH1_9LACT|nr:hypothetical protein [Falseniella ignava]EKB58334.1 hypothetical protein HMPREF9707_00283 [Falseniella ignava CCUG 37419]
MVYLFTVVIIGGLAFFYLNSRNAMMKFQQEQERRAMHRMGSDTNDTRRQMFNQSQMGEDTDNDVEIIRKK